MAYTVLQSLIFLVSNSRFWSLTSGSARAPYCGLHVSPF